MNEYNLSDTIPVEEVGNIIRFKGEYGYCGEPTEVIMSITAPRGKMLLFKSGREAVKLLAIKSFMEEHGSG